MKKIFDLSANSEVLGGFRSEQRSFLERTGWDPKEIGQIVLAVDEALTNVIRHAYEDASPGVMKVVLEDLPDRLEIMIEDRGRKFDPTKLPPPKLPREKPGGLGIHLIRTIMDELIYDTAFTEGNRLRMIKRKSKIAKREGAA